MTPDEQKKLDDIHRALFTVPPGASDKEKPLIQSIRDVVQAYNRASWAARALIWAILTIGSVLGALVTIRSLPETLASFMARN